MHGKVIDIGVGEDPYFLRFRMDCDAEEYVGVDMNEKSVEAARRMLEAGSKFRLPPRREFVVANATRLPFKDGTFDTAVLSNLLSAPIHWGWSTHSPEHTVRGFGPQDLFYVEREKVIAEALRVLRPGGRLLIYTDLVVHGHYSYNALLWELKENKGLTFNILKEEQDRIDALNIEKVRSGEFCYCFMGGVLPASSVYEIIKLNSL